jgi:hypothetical protein
MSKKAIGGPELEQLLGLNSFPPETVGYYQELYLLCALYRLCEENGYGRLYQLMEQINEIWRDPTRAEYWRNWYRDRNDALAKTQEELGEKT